MMSGYLSLNDSAYEWINKQINKDGQFRDIATKINYKHEDCATISGFNDSDYSLSGCNVGGELEFEKTTSLPPELLDKFKEMKKCCCMGVFTMCNKSWLTIDNELFIWNLEDGKDLAFYDDCDGVIISVCLVRPRAGILPVQVEYLLCLATSDELIVLGVTYDYSTSQDGYTSAGVFNVLSTPLYRLQTENNNITCMEATSNGRLFMGTREGYLLEFNFSVFEAFLATSELPIDHISGPCSLTNHTASSLRFLLPSILTVGFRPSGAITQIVVDGVRGQLFTLSSNSHLAVYQYATTKSKQSPTYLTKLASLSGSELISRASATVRSIDRQHFATIVYICCLSGDGPIQMMAVTQSGIRIFFSDCLRIAHVRLPPSQSASGPSMFDSAANDNLPLSVPSSPFCLGEIKLVAETRGTVVFASTAQKPPSADKSLYGSNAFSSVDVQQYPETNVYQQDQQMQPQNLVLTVVSPDSYPWSPGLTETFTTSISVASPWSIVVIPDASDGQASTSSELSASSFNRRGIELPTPRDSNSDEISCGVPLTPEVHRGPPPVVLTQHLDAPYRRILIISAHGIIHLRLPSPMQRLRDFLASHGGTSLSLSPLVGVGLSNGNSNEAGFLSAFLQQFGPEESVCGAIAIAADAFRVFDTGNQRRISSGPQDDLVAQAERAILFFASESTRFWPCPVVSLTSPLGPVLAGGGLPFANTTAVTAQRNSDAAGQVAGTFFLVGATLFLSRIARSVWRAPMLAVADQTQLDQAQARSPGFLPKDSAGGLTSLLYTLVTTAISKASSRDADKDNVVITSRLSPDDLGWLLHQLCYLKDLLDRQLNSPNNWFRQQQISAQQLHTPSINSGSNALCRLVQDLSQLISAFIEFVGLWHVISQHSVHDIAKLLTQEQKTDLLSLPIEAFICWMPRTAFPPSLPPNRISIVNTTTPGNIQDLRSSLIAALIEHYFVTYNTGNAQMQQSSSIDALCASLRRVCPNLFANEDALCAKADELLIRASGLASTATTTINDLILEAVDLFTSAGPGINVGLAALRLEATVGAWPLAASLCLSVAQRRDPSNIAVACLRDGRPPLTITGTGSDKIEPQSEFQIVESRYEAYRHLLDCLGRLLVAANLPSTATNIPQISNPTEEVVQNSDRLAVGPNPAPPVARRCLLSVLHSIIKCDDTLAHFEVIGWLLSNGLVEQVVALGSPHLEAYLQSRLRQSPNDVALRCLLWRQLESRGARLEAARVLHHLAVAPTSGQQVFDLDDRLDYLARAIIAVKALPPSQCDADFLADIQDRLDTAELQRQLCAELSAYANHPNPASPGGYGDEGYTEDRSEAIQLLTHGPLLSVSDLFTKYADPYDLHESKLLLLRFAGEADADLVRAIWTALLHRLLVAGENHQGCSPRGQHRQSASLCKASASSSSRRLELSLTGCMFRLFSRLASPSGQLTSTSSTPSLSGVGIDYSFFPLPVIISTLERYAIQLGLASNWVPCVLMDSKIPASAELVEAYNITLCNKDPFWLHESVRARLMEVIQFIVSEFLVAANSLSLRQRQLQASRMLDHLTTHLVEMHAEPTGLSSDKQQRGQLVDRLQNLRNRLDRLTAQ